MTRLVPRSRRDRLLVALLTGAFLEIIWCIYLGLVLPPHYVAHHWALAWIGLDVAEVSMLFASAWAAWRQRALLILFTIVGATLFLLDAWFDVTTANHGDVTQSLVLAAFLEVPSAIALLWVARRAVIRFLLTHRAEDVTTPFHKLVLTRGVEPNSRARSSPRAEG
ncbi:MAG: hypothetical protein ACRDVC_02285 [Acidimicrobiales bacterium]